ncbi:MAG TPA: nitroreductase family deazaflavin-dependent oxidoreductase [Tepidiformaceae bacterium]|nr:nitroreductase family deazaflavin-dependent oxidoreductase [Tepidiformaceae bacterium]
MARIYALSPSRKFVNAAMSTLIKVGVGSASMYLMTTTGRRTGEPRTTPVTLVESDGERWLVAPYGNVSWVHNVTARPVLELRRGRHRETLSAERVDASTAAPILRQYVQKVAVTRPYFDAQPQDDLQAFIAEASKHPVFRLTNPTAEQPT